MQKYILITAISHSYYKKLRKTKFSISLNYSCKLCDFITFPEQFRHMKVNLLFYLLCIIDNFSLTDILKNKQKIKCKT